jgi:hypothetical protein
MIVVPIETHKKLEKIMEFTIEKLKNLRPGESFVYFVGFLDGERLKDPLGDSNTVAAVAYDLAANGRILLTQKRISSPKTKGGHIDWQFGQGRGFEYIATGAIPKQNYYQHALNPLKDISNEKGRPDSAREQGHGRSRPTPQIWRL